MKNSLYKNSRMLSNHNISNSKQHDIIVKQPGNLADCGTGLAGCVTELFSLLAHFFDSATCVFSM